MLRAVAVVLLSIAVAGGCTRSKPNGASSGSATITPPPSPAIDATVAIDAAPVDAASAEGSGSGSAAGSAADADESAFDKLSHDEKVKFMKTKVLPPMKAAFQKVDPKDYANFGCKTCHGKDAQKNKYKMPNKDLKALDFDAIKAGKEDKVMVDFMTKTVKPEMAKILGQPEMDETHRDGFGCLECHTVKKK